MAVPVTSGTYNFLPSLGELGLTAFSRIQIRRSEITEEHMINLRLAANLLLVEWSIDGPNLWAVDLQTIELIPGQASYDLDPTTVAILDAYVDIPNGDGTFTSLIIYPISRTEYASQPEKSQQGRPSTYWMDRLISPTITFWLVPDDTQSYTLRFYRMRQLQDANFTSGQQVDIPNRFLEAFASGLAAKLAEIYKPEMLQLLEQRASVKWAKATQQDVETGIPLMLGPGLSSYYR